MSEWNYRIRIAVPGRLLLFLAWYILSPPETLYSQTENWMAGTRAAALANAYSMESDIWSSYHNQAGLGYYKDFSIGFHHENKFVVEEYNMHALALTVPVKPGTFGFSYSYFGYKFYNETKIGLGFGRQFGEKISAGIQINLHHNYLEGEFGDRNALSYEGGIQYRPVDHIRFGAHLFNPGRSTISPNDRDTIPTVFRTGIAWIANDQLFLAAEAEKRLDRKIVLKGGLEYCIFENLYLRAGIWGEPIRSTFGLGYKISRISADIAFSHHEILGFTPHFSLQAGLGQKK